MEFFSSRRFVTSGFFVVIAGMAVAHVLYMKQEFGQSTAEALRPIAIIVFAMFVLQSASWLFKRLGSKNAR